MALILIRGLPGSGKSTLARRLAAEYGFVHLENDMYFERDGVYRYIDERLRDAMAWCQERAGEALARGQHVVVSNVFNQLSHLSDYQIVATLHQIERVGVMELSGQFGSTRGVSQECIRVMRDNWFDRRDLEKLTGYEVLRSVEAAARFAELPIANPWSERLRTSPCHGASSLAGVAAGRH